MFLYVFCFILFPLLGNFGVLTGLNDRAQLFSACPRNVSEEHRKPCLSAYHHQPPGTLTSAQDSVSKICCICVCTVGVNKGTEIYIYIYTALYSERIDLFLPPAKKHLLLIWAQSCPTESIRDKRIEGKRSIHQIIME